MKSDDKIRDQKHQHVINKEAAKISAWSSRKKWKIWISYRWRNIPFYQAQITEQDKFAYSPLRKTFEKQTTKFKI